MNKIWYSFKQSLKQIKRNFGMALTSIFAITAMLLILGLFFMIIVNVNLAAESVKQDYNLIEIFLEDNTKVKEGKSLATEIKSWDNVNTTEYKTKEDALESLKERWGESGYLLDGLAENPLPNSLIITLDNIENSDSIADKLSDLHGVEDVKYYKDTVKKLVRVTDIFQIGAVVLMIFLIIVSLIVVSNTIKLTVFNRAEEIMIMKYVGATNWFIRAPFLFEGIIIGLISSLTAFALEAFLYYKISIAFSKELLTIFSTPMVPIEFFAFNLGLIFIAIGISVGTWGSIISMRRFLDT
ncbi:MAG: permease-like cell division protein FtsX [Anaerovoracaceae bacterium]